MILHLVRHARSDGADNRCIGHTDLPLSRSSSDDARHTAARWQLGAIAGLQCISSDLDRACETATLLTAPDTQRQTDPRLREMNFGEWDGREWDDIERTDGAGLQSWMADWTTVRAPGGESFGDVIKRVSNLLDELPRDGDGTTLIVAHAGSIRAACIALLGVPAMRAFSLAVDHLHLHSFSLTADSSTLIRWNASGF